MSEKRFKLSKYVTPSSVSNFCDENGRMLNKEVVKVLNEQQEKITELEIELTDCKNRKEQLEYKNTKLIAKIDFLERVIDGDINE